VLGTLETLGDYGLALSQQGVMRVTDTSALHTLAQGAAGRFADKAACKKKRRPQEFEAARRKKEPA